MNTKINAIVLTLPDSKDRQEAFAKCKPKGLDIETWFAKSGDDVTPPVWWRSSANMWSHAVNFMDIFEKYKVSDRPLLLFEDDAKPAPDFCQRLETLLAHVPDDWEVLYLGGHRMDFQQAPAVEVNEHVLRIRYLRGTWGMVFHPRAMQRLIDGYNIVPWTCLHVPECRLAQLTIQGRVKAYAPKQFFVAHAAGPSTLCSYTLEHEITGNGFKYIPAKAGGDRE